MKPKDSDHDEVVGLYINEDIYIGPTAVKEALKQGRVDGYILRHVFKFMADFDLDPKWKEYSQYPTLFTLTEYSKWLNLPQGKPIF